MAVVTPEQALERMHNFFHGINRSFPGHSPDERNCWQCLAAAYAVTTSPSRHVVKSKYALKSGVLS